MEKFTKGKWKEQEFMVGDGLGGQIKHIYIYSNEGEYTNRTLADIGFWRDFPEEMVYANAHLIAAAPEMYFICLLLDSGSDSDIELAKIKTWQALAKARGEKCTDQI